MQKNMGKARRVVNHMATKTHKDCDPHFSEYAISLKEIPSRGTHLLFFQFYVSEITYMYFQHIWYFSVA